jgi:hypothetical protein
MLLMASEAERLIPFMISAVSAMSLIWHKASFCCARRFVRYWNSGQKVDFCASLLGPE